MTMVPTQSGTYMRPDYSLLGEKGKDGTGAGAKETRRNWWDIHDQSPYQHTHQGSWDWK